MAFAMALSSINFMLPLETKSLKLFIPFFLNTSPASILINLSISLENIAALNMLSLMVLNPLSKEATLIILLFCVPIFDVTLFPMSPSDLNNSDAFSELPNLGSLNILTNTAVSSLCIPKTKSFKYAELNAFFKSATPSLAAKVPAFFN